MPNGRALIQEGLFCDLLIELQQSGPVIVLASKPCVMNGRRGAREIALGFEEEQTSVEGGPTVARTALSLHTFSYARWDAAKGRHSHPPGDRLERESGLCLLGLGLGRSDGSQR